MRRNEAAAVTSGEQSTDWMNLYCFQEQTRYYNPKDQAFTFERPSLGYFPNERMGPGIVRAWKDARYTYPRFSNTAMHAI
jgi:hypothetical protein